MIAAPTYSSAHVCARVLTAAHSKHTHTHAHMHNPWRKQGKRSRQRLGCQTLIRGLHCCSYSLAGASDRLSLPFNIIYHLRLSLTKSAFKRLDFYPFFHSGSLPQTSSNLSFSLQWSCGDVCSLPVQLNFKKLYAHA